MGIPAFWTSPFLKPSDTGIPTGDAQNADCFKVASSTSDWGESRDANYKLGEQGMAQW